MTDIESRFTAFSGILEALGIFALIMIALALAELLWDLATRRRTGLKESFANIAIALVNALLDRTLYGAVFIVALFVAEAFVPYRLPVNLWSWAAAVLLADFSYYWMHRLEHRIRALWCYHSVHHSSPEYNLTTAYRLAWTESLVEWIFFVPMILLGFDAAQTVIALAVVVTYQTWIHTGRIGRLGPLEGILNTPSAHRVHHGSNRRYLDRNYGGILILWDRLFGTYQPEEEPVVFGLTEPVGSANPLVINFHEYLALARDCRRARTPGDAGRHLVKPPGWKPAEPDSQAGD